MQGYIRNVIILIVAMVIVAIVALFWPRPCTPDVECVDYADFVDQINAR